MLIYLQMVERDDDKEKITRLYEQYRDFMFLVAYKVLKDNADSEDAVHQAFLSIIKNLEKIDEVDSAKTKGYLAIIVERKAIDIIRNRSKVVSLDAIENISGMEITILEDNSLANAMSKLSGYYREVLLLRYCHGYTSKEIGRLFGCSTGTIQKTIWRAKQALYEELKLGGKA